MNSDKRNQAIKDKIEHFKKVSLIQKKANREMPVDGERHTICLEGRNIDVVYYNRKKENVPVIFAAFGGGFVLGGCALDNTMWSYLSREWDCQLISIGYRKSLEAPYPSAVYDFYEAVCFFWEHAVEFKFDKKRIITFGSSAGANITAAAALLDQKKKTGFITTQILNYPYLDMVTDPEEKGHTQEELLSYYIFPELYIPEKEKREDSLASPIQATMNELKNMPKTIINAGGADALRTEAFNYAHKLLQAGNDVCIKVYPGMPHGFIEFYFSLQNTGQDIAFCPMDVRQCFEDGSLKTYAEEALYFIRENLETK
jgi:acetyl esterase